MPIKAFLKVQSPVSGTQSGVVSKVSFRPALQGIAPPLVIQYLNFLHDNLAKAHARIAVLEKQAVTKQEADQKYGPVAIKASLEVGGSTPLSTYGLLGTPFRFHNVTPTVVSSTVHLLPAVPNPPESLLLVRVPSGANPACVPLVGGAVNYALAANQITLNTGLAAGESLRAWFQVG